MSDDSDDSADGYDALADDWSDYAEVPWRAQVLWPVVDELLPDVDGALPDVARRARDEDSLRHRLPSAPKGTLKPLTALVRVFNTGDAEINKMGRLSKIHQNCRARLSAPVHRPDESRS